MHFYILMFIVTKLDLWKTNNNWNELNWTDVVMMSPWDVRFIAVAMNTVFWYVILFYLLPWRWKQPDYPPTHPRRQYSSWAHITNIFATAQPKRDALNNYNCKVLLWLWTPVIFGWLLRTNFRCYTGTSANTEHLYISSFTLKFRFKVFTKCLLNKK